jgi:uncharacterized protein (DUF2267 family)
MKPISHLWDKTLAKTNVWLEQVGRELGWAEPDTVLLALRSVLHALRDRLPPDEAVELAAQMPLLLKGVYFDGWNPSATPVKARTREEFFALVRGPLRGGPMESDAERVTRAVFRVLADHVSQGEIRDVRGALPAELVDLWPEAAGFTATSRSFQDRRLE